jgi:hypothetical protein
MQTNRAISVLRSFFFLTTVIAIAGTGQAKVRFGGGSLSANGRVTRGFQYAGSCPVHLRFAWGVISTESAKATYSFTRNDGGHSTSLQTIDLPANRSVSVPDDWALGENTPEFREYHGWEQLTIESPDRVSQKIGFTIRCASSHQQNLPPQGPPGHQQNVPPPVQPAQTSPVISNISPSAGSASQTVTISGSGFSGVNRVMFNSRLAAINSASDTKLVVTTPALPNVPSFGTNTSVLVCTPAGCSKPGTFKYQP